MNLPAVSEADGRRIQARQPNGTSPSRSKSKPLTAEFKAILSRRADSGKETQSASIPSLHREAGPYGPAGQEREAQRELPAVLGTERHPNAASSAIGAALRDPMHRTPAASAEASLVERLPREQQPVDGASGSADPVLENTGLLSDPMQRVLATLQPPQPSGAMQPPPALVVDQIAANLLRRFSYASQRGSGTVRLEFGAGAMAGGSLIVHCEGSDLRLELDAPDGLDSAELARRIEHRLISKGLSVAELSVR